MVPCGSAQQEVESDVGQIIQDFFFPLCVDAFLWCVRTFLLRRGKVLSMP